MNLSKIKIQILNELMKSTEFINAKTLAFRTSVSVRSIKTYIKEINEIISKYGISIVSKKGSGYIFYKNKNNQLKEFISLMYDLENKEKDIYSVNTRIDYIIKALIISENNKLEIKKLLNKLYISDSTLNKDLILVKNRLSLFRIKLNINLEYISLNASETDLRLCIFDYNITNYNNYDLEMINKLKLILKEFSKKYNISMSINSIDNFAKNIKIGLDRYNLNNKIYVYKNETRWNLLDEDSLAMTLSQKLSDEIYKEFNILLNKEEIMYYALHFKCKIINYVLNENENKKATICVGKIIREIHNNFDLDFSDNKVLEENLKLHIPSMVTRIKAHIIIKNPIVYNNLRRYLFATKMTHSAFRIIEKEYNIKYDINEFGYLVLFFQMALTKKINEEKINIGLVNSLGNSEQFIYFEEIYSNFSFNRYNFIELNYDNQNKEIKKLDLIISTFKINKYKNINKYIIENDDYIEEIRLILEKLPYKNFKVSNYFIKENFITKMQAYNKEEVINKVYKFLKKGDYFKKNINSLAGFDYAELGKGIVHLQDTDKILKKSICLFIILDKPIYWEENIARIIILTKTKKNNDTDLFALCNTISKWASNDQNIIRVIENRNIDSFLKDINI